MPDSKITVVVPVYNVEKYLSKCIDSIINQTYQNIELILVNDGSTDSSLEICRKFKNDNRVIIIDKPNGGLSSARQAGIDKASGDYICMIDSDDYIEIDFVEKMYKKIYNDKSDICVCETRFYSDDKEKIYGFNEDIEECVKLTKDILTKKYFSLIINYYMSDSWNKIYRTSFIKESNVRFTLEKKYNGTDLLFNHRLILHAPQISILKEPLYNHQILENSRVRRKNKELQKGFMLIMSQIINETDKLKYTHLIDQELNYLYVKFLREAAQDVFNSEMSISQLMIEYKNFIDMNESYLKQQSRLNPLKPSMMHTSSLKMFCNILNSKNSIILYLYLSLRRRIKK